MATDLILSAATNYDWDQLKYFVNSINRSGFSGDVIMFIMNGSKATVEKLVENNVYVIGQATDEEGNLKYESGMPIHVERFFHFFNYLHQNAYKYRNVLICDNKDIVFQTDPSRWLEDHLNMPMVAGSECLKYKDEAWGSQNLEQTFGPYFHDLYKHNTIYNVGFWGGRSEYVRDMCLSIFQMALNRPIAICDQAVFNMLLFTAMYQDTVQLAQLSDALVCHLGTLMDPHKMTTFEPLLLEAPPYFDGDVFKNVEGKTFVAVHQYDRSIYSERVKEIYG